MLLYKLSKKEVPHLLPPATKSPVPWFHYYAYKTNVLREKVNIVNVHLRPQDWKRSVFIPIPKKGNAKECSNYHTIALTSVLARLCSESFKLGFSSTWTKNVQMCNLGLEKAEIKSSIFAGSWRKQENSRKACTSALLTMLKSLTIWIITNCRKFLKRWNTRPSYLSPGKPVCGSRKVTARTGHGATD